MQGHQDDRGASRSRRRNSAVKVLAEKIADGDAPPEDAVFEAVAARYIAYQKRRVKAGDLSEAELIRQTGIVETHLIPFLRGLKIAKIRRVKLNAYIESRTGEVSAGSIFKEVNTLRHLFTLACENWDLIKENPAKGLKLPAAPPGRTRHLSPEELARLFKMCPEWLTPVVGLAVSTGMRRGELLRIRWRDVYQAAGRILLPHTNTKSGRERFVYLNDLSRSVIASLNPEEHKAGDLLFPGLTPAQVTVAFIRTCKQAGIEDCSIHCLRHTYAALCRQNNVDLHTLSKLLGHSDLRMTNRYAHLGAEHLSDAAQSLNQALPASLILAKNP